MVPTSPLLYAVLGNPVRHSQSPLIHAAFAAQTGQAMGYTRVLCPLDGFADSVHGFVHSGGRGCNVTVPFKFEALALAAQASERARLAGAANLLRFDAGGWFADNTDGVGLVNDIQQHAGVALAGQRVLLVGAGGAAAGALGTLLACAPAQVVLANRTLAKAQALVERHAATAAQHGVDLQARGLHAAGMGFGVVVNSSASSLQGAAVPVPATVLAPGALALDMMYGPAAAPFLAWAQAHGATAREQAAESFWLWHGVRPHTPAVLAALRQHLAQAEA
jgi:shikimate dehydrogenase